MSELSIEALAVCVRENPEYRPLSTLTGPGADPESLLPLVQSVAELTGVPVARLEMLTDAGDGKDVSAQALAALGPPPCGQPLFLVRSGPLADPFVAPLTRTVHLAEWEGEDVGITHLDELGGTAVLDMLSWAVPEETGGTAVICDEPLFADTLTGAVPVTAVGLRLCRGAGPLRFLACGEGPPGRDEVSAARHFPGSGPCESWLALHGALHEGSVGAGERLLLHTTGPRREGWAVLECTDPAALRLAGPLGADPRSVHGDPAPCTETRLPTRRKGEPSSEQ